ncbi:hypothetical protein SRHO_G00055760 [Serrasalmus rhombeus]
MSCQVAHEKVITTPFPSFPALPFLICLSLSHDIMSQPRPPAGGGGGGGGGRLVQHHGWDCMLQELLFHSPCIVSKAWGHLETCEGDKAVAPFLVEAEDVKERGGGGSTLIGAAR